MVKLYGIEHHLFPQATKEEIYAYFKQKEFIAVDSETTGLDPHVNQIRCIQLGDFDTQFVIAADKVHEFKTPLEKRILIFHNAKFDLKFLYKVGIYPRKVYDTFLAEGVIHCGIQSAKKNLAAVCFNRIGIKLNKGEREGIWNKAFTAEVIRYAADDVKYLEKIMISQLEDLVANDLLDALDIDNQFVLCLAYIELCGLKLDKAKWEAKCVRDKAELESSKAKIDQFIIDNNIDKFIEKQGDLFDIRKKACINWNSSEQVVELFKMIGVPTELIEDGEEKDSVSATNVQKYSNDYPLINDYLHYREVQKITSTYGENFIKQINPVTGRLHTSFKQIMSTGRLSCGGKDKALNIQYLNFQNIPSDKETRSCFISEEGHVMISCDYTGQEDIVFTQLSQEEKLLEFYNDTTRKRDGHSFVAKLCFPKIIGKTKEEDVKALFPEQRSAAKSAKFAIHYGGNGLTVARNLNIPKEEGLAVEAAYFEAFPGIKEYFEREKRKALDNGYVLFNKVSRRKSYIFGYKEYLASAREFDKEFWLKYRYEKDQNDAGYKNNFNELKDKVSKYFKFKGTIERKALNYPVQGTSADITKIACIYIWNWIKENNYINIVLFPNVVHDECIVECPEELKDKTMKAVQDCMERAGAIYCTDVRLKAVPEVGHCWIH